MATYFTSTMDYEKPEPRHRLCLQFDAVTLQQRGRDNFAVRYGKQVVDELTYAGACAELGRSLMHQGACEGMIDNRTKNER